VSDTSSFTVESLAHGIKPVSEAWRAQARQRLDTLTKPLGSLGRLETVAAQFVAIRREWWQEPIRKGVYVFAADHGVTAEGVSAYPSEVTQQMVLNFCSGGAAISVLAKLYNVELAVIDVGVAGDFGDTEGVLDRQIARGTRNLRREAAMSEDQVLRALVVGAEMADAAALAGQNVVAIGEMGIGNTTAASAITCVLAGVPASVATGHGTGITSEAYAHKIAVVQASVEKHCGSTATASPFEILRCLGGLEIAAMVGMILQAARHQLVIVVDGFISTAAAAIAEAISPASLGYMIAGHQSEEPGHRVLLENMRLRPLLTLDMRLGEGTGAVLAMPLIESAMALYTNMATFDAAGVSGATA